MHPQDQQQQPDLPGMAEAFREVGLESLPTGLSALTKRQRIYCLEYLRTGNQTEAARRAGYSDPASDGAKVQKSPAVQAVLGQAAVTVAKDADQLIKRNWQRSVSLHALYEAELAKPETLRSESRMMRLAAELAKVDGLLGSLLGKIGNVSLGNTTINNTSTHIGFTLPPTALPVLAQMRRDATEATRN